MHITCDAAIVLTGKNTIRAGDVSADGAQSWALVVDGACTVSGGGDLTLVSGRAAGEGGQSVAILAAGTLEFAGTGDVRALSGAADYSCAVSGLADVTFTSGCVSMSGGDFACAAANDGTITLPARAQVAGATETAPQAARRSGRSTFYVSGEPAAQVQVAAPGAGNSAGLFFEDVCADDWFCGDVGYVLQSGLMSGTSRTQFSPSRTTTRGMIVTILYRLAGTPAVDTAAPYIRTSPRTATARTRRRGRRRRALPRASAADALHRSGASRARSWRRCSTALPGGRAAWQIPWQKSQMRPPSPTRRRSPHTPERLPRGRRKTD